MSATAADVIIEQLKAKEAIVELTSYELAVLTESATTVSRVVVGFDLR